jgi:hypothetical protein
VIAEVPLTADPQVLCARACGEVAVVEVLRPAATFGPDWWERLCAGHYRLLLEADRGA